MPAPISGSMSAKAAPAAGMFPRRDRLVCAMAVVAALLLLATGLLTLRAFTAIRATNRVDDEVRTAQFVSESFVAALTDAETGQRGYLLTGDPAYLQPYNAAPALIDAALARMRQAPDPARAVYLARITGLTRAKLAELRRTVAMREAGDEAGALAVVRGGSGKKMMDAVRAEVTTLQRLGAARIAHARQAAAAAEVGIWSAAMGAVAVLLLALLSREWLRERASAAVNLAARDRFVRAFGLTRGMLRDMDGRITFWGPGMESLYGYGTQTALGRISHDLLATQFSEPVAAIEASLLANGDWQGELSHRARNGSVTSVMSHWVLLPPDAEGKLSVVEMNYDTSAIRQAETYLQLALDAAGLGIWSWDAGGAVPMVLDARSKALLLLPAGHAGGTSLGLILDEDRPAAIAAVARLLDPADPTDTDTWEFRPSAEVSQPVWLAASCRVQFVADAAAPAGRIAVRLIGTLRDISASRRAEQERRQTENLLLQTIVETAPGPIYAKDRAGKFMLANVAALGLLGRRWADVEGRRDLDVLGDTEQARAVAANDERIMASGLAEEVEEHAGGENGHARTWLCNKSPLRGANGSVVGLVGVSVEISDRKRAEESQALMIHELNHRVKNTLSTVQAIAAETMKDAPAPMRAALEGRLLALAAVHDVLTREAWQGAGLHEVVAASLQPFGGAGRFEVSGPPMPLLPRAALALAMGLHELATNAVKYGALQGAAGGVTICWHVSAHNEPHLELVWLEHGGPPVVVPAARSFGTRMIEGALAWDLGGTAKIDFEPAGVRCVIEAPLAEVAARAEKVALPRVGRL